MTNFGFSKEQILGLAALCGAGLAGLAGFMAGKNQKKPWTNTDHASAYWEGFADGMTGVKNHEYSMKELETRPKVVEKTIEVPVPEKPTPMVMMAKAIEACMDANRNNEDDENEEDE